METERWKRVDSILYAALDRAPGEREAFVRRECAGDEALEAEVRSLMAAEPAAGGILDRPLAGDSTITHLAGQTVSHYRILETLGAGGMGVVYKAYDSKLARPVALKFLPPHLRHNEELKRRLKEEALAASTLDHPNVVVIYDIDETPEGDLFIAMALHEGVTLRERIEQALPGPLPVGEALHIAKQIGAGLGKAHERGIFHRDIKPSNVIVAKDGVARIIDFGLAKTSEATATADGSTKGTPLYMSPEQASGKPLDCRTDLWSLGAVLFEMLSGRPPFTGEGNLPVMRAIVHDAAPKLRDLRPETPEEVERIVSRALEKDPARRYQTAGEMVGDLSAALADLEHTGGTGTPRRVGRGVPLKWVIAAAAVVVAALAIAGYFYTQRKPKLTDKDTVLLGEFENKTGDPVFDGTLRQGLEAQLEQSPFLSMVPEERIQHLLKLMGQPPDARLTPRVAREVCERASSAAVLEGSIGPVGSQYILWLRARNCRSGEVLDVEQMQAAKKEDVLSVLGQMAGRFRTKVGESLATVEKHDTPLPEVTTSSLEALKAYSTAWKVWYSTGPAAALPHLQRAIGLDPQFVLAHAFLAHCYAALWEAQRGADSAAKAFAMRNRVSDPERFFILVPHYMDETGSLEKAEQAAQEWADTYPRDVRPRGFLSAIGQCLGKYEKSVDDGRKAVAMDAHFPPAYNNLAWAYEQLNRSKEAEQTIKDAGDHGVAFPEFLVIRYYIAVLRGDAAAMQREALQSEQNADVGDWIMHAEACTLAFSGRLTEARKKSRQAADAARSDPHKTDRAALWEAGAAVREALFGNRTEAKRAAEAALGISKGRDVEYGAAVAFALAGDPARSRAVAKHLETLTEDTDAMSLYLPAIRALWALDDGDAAKAIDLLQTAAPYELAAPGSATGLYGILFPIYVRGRAYMLANRGREAAAEFQKILDWPGLVFTDPVGAIARLQLARALVLSGDTAKGKEAYQDFLIRWKDADRDIPVFKEAQAALAGLR